MSMCNLPYLAPQAPMKQLQQKHAGLPLVLKYKGYMKDGHRIPCNKYGIFIDGLVWDPCPFKFNCKT